MGVYVHPASRGECALEQALFLGKRSDALVCVKLE